MKNLIIIVGIFKVHILLFFILLINFSIVYNFTIASYDNINHIDEYILINKNKGKKDLFIKETLFNQENNSKILLNNLFNNNIKNINKNNSGLIIGSILEIPKIGILQPMYVMSIGDYKNLELKKDKDIIDFELNNLFNIDDGFIIGGHSSGYITNKSPFKDIFKDLNLLNQNDIIIINTNINGNIIKNKYIVKEKKIGKNIHVKKTDFVIFTCYPNQSSKERLVLFLDKI